MAGPDRSPARWSVAALLILLLAPGCASQSAKPLDPPTGTTASAPPPAGEASTPTTAATAPANEVEVVVPPAPEPPPMDPPPIEPSQPEPEPDDQTVVTIDTGARDVTEKRKTLAEAARAERERRHIAEPTNIVITDKTLAEYATGDLTTADTSPRMDAEQEAASDYQKEMEAKEAYWRGRAREVRQAWRDAYDKIPELEEKVFELRQAFYREDDGFYRDAEIKPAWDRAIEQLEEAHSEVEARQQELNVLLEEGRAVGALPGWLREGIDLEPTERIESDDTAEPGEPVIYQQEASDPP